MKRGGRIMPRIKSTKPDIPHKAKPKFDERGLCIGWWSWIEDLKTTATVHHTEGGMVRPEGVKRMRLRCPRCGRRVWSSISTCSDGCCVYHNIPPHKPKRWWRK